MTLPSAAIPPLPDEFVLPAYDDGSLANIPATVAKLLEVPFSGLPPLREDLWRPLAGRTRRVIVLLLDSFGWELFEREAPRLDWLVERSAVRGKMTTVFPSTTVAALSSLWTGFAPAQHGLVGLELFFPEQAVLGQLLSFSPAFARFPGSLTEAGVTPEAFLQVPGMAEQLAAAGVPSYAFKGREIVNSPLSRMHDRGVLRTHGNVTAADLFVQLRRLLEESAGQPLYANAYWPALDTLSHNYGPADQTVTAELHGVLALLKTELLDRLSPAARRNTVLFITGDHGQVLAPPHQFIHLDDHPELKARLLMRPAGEPRTSYLYARQGETPGVLAYLTERLADAAWAVESQAALEAGLLGPPPYASKTADRLGDVMVTMRGAHLLLTPRDMAKVEYFQGRHGGMTAAEMEIPWLGLALE